MGDFPSHENIAQTHTVDFATLYKTHEEVVPVMPWFSVEAPSLTDQQIQEVVTRTIAEAHKRIGGTF